MLFLYHPHPTTHPQTTHNNTKSIIETYDTNDFTEHETVSDNEISLPFKPLTTRNKDKVKEEQTLKLLEKQGIIKVNWNEYYGEIVEEELNTKTKIGIALVAIGLCVVALLA
jgi:hypothetical protein